MLQGEYGKATKKAMEILVALGKIYHAEKLIPITSVQIAGVSYDNLGEAGLAFLNQMADDNASTRVLTTLNPAGMDIENWQNLGISREFAEKQMLVIDTFKKMNVITTCSCTPYLFGNTPHFGEHIAWAESSAVCYANSILGARTNREGGPSALAASLTGRTAAYGLHLNENRIPKIAFKINFDLSEQFEFGALGKIIGEKIESSGNKPIPLICGIPEASMENLKSFCASIATFGGSALFHMRSITPEASLYKTPDTVFEINREELDQAISSLNQATSEDIDFISLGCPHLSLKEIAKIAELLDGKKVTKEFWITTARPIKDIADRMGYTEIIEKSGAKFAADTCCVVAPIKGRFNALATDSAKACYYAYAKNKFNTRFRSFEDTVMEATR